MRNLFKLFGIIAFTAVIVFGLIGCPNDNNNNQPLFSVSGEFKGAGTGNALFKAATAETASRSVNLSYELTGELEDGDMVFRLRGTYDSSTGSYTVSSASSFARYTISGDERGATATLAVKEGEEWRSFIVNVTIKDVSVKGGQVQEYAGGLPSWAQGSWHDWWTSDTSNYNANSFEAWSYFDQWYYEAWRSSVWRDNWDFTVTKYTVISAEDIGNGVYDVILSYPLYRATDAQKKTALENFFRDINHPAEFWNKKFNPWDPDVWDCDNWNDPGENAGKNWDNSVIWYICVNEDHVHYLGTKIINWETFITFFETEEERQEFFDAAWVSNEAEWWEKKEKVEELFAEKNVSNYYYWGWFEDGHIDEDHQNRIDRGDYTCWEPACEVDGIGGWWDITHYYVKWGNQTGIQGDWDTYRDLFNRWTSEDYLVTYLRSQNVQPETWYTRVRMWKDVDTLVVYYYNGDNEAQDNEHSAPACDTKSLSKIQGLPASNFNIETYPDWSYYWHSGRTSPRN